MLFYDLVKKDLDELELEIEKMIPKKPKEVYQMLFPYVKRGGKRIRPVLCFLCCRAVGGDSQKLIKLASIIELFHNFTLIHDDIEDGSQMRRGERTLHRQYGVPVALNSGDALYTLIWKEIINLELKEKDKKEIENLCVNAFRRVVEGQGIELNWHTNKIFDVTEEDYINMASGKTSALLGLCCEIGACLGGADKKVTKALRNAGEYLGLSFQIQDDLLNVTGNFERYKKEIGGDVSEGKRTLLVAYALKNANDNDKKTLKNILSSNSKNKEDINKIISIFKKTGAMEHTHKKAEEFKLKAIENINHLNNSKEKKALIEIAEYITKREE